MSTAPLFFVTTSPCWDWVICAPAAFLGCGSRFSGCLSGIEPRFPVSRQSHGRHLTYRQADSSDTQSNRHRHKAMRSAWLFRVTSSKGHKYPTGLDLINALHPSQGEALLACISSRITTDIQVNLQIQETTTDLLSHSRFHTNCAHT